MKLTTGDIERFLRKVEIKDKSCWEWEGAKYQNGYGQFSLRRGNRKTFSAHRISWIIFNDQDIPDGKMVCHKCDNRICVNPSHLYVGTGYENNRDTVARNRGNRHSGERCSWAKLKSQDVIAIRESQESQAELAAKYRVDPSTICQILSYKRWKHLQVAQIA
jgi:hypothetical protein